MDLHIVPGVKARGIAEAHQLDLATEEEFDCKCMTYWIDESRGNVFCLIDAPNKEAVISMHAKAHGLTPHRIIEVQPSLVEAFLGRVSDPDDVARNDEGLKVFHEPSFRILLMAECEDPALLRARVGKEKAALLMQRQRHAVQEALSSHNGSEVEYKGSALLASFTSAAKALACAVTIQQQLPGEEALRISLSAGEPVAKNENLFGDTILTASRLCFLARDARPVVTAAVNELAAKNAMGEKEGEWMALSPPDEAFLYQLFSTLDEKYAEPSFLLEDYCQLMAMSQSQLYRKVVALSGLSPNALLKEFRLHKAKDLLKKKQHSIAEVSFETGFTSPSYFTKCFKNRYGLLPLAYTDLL
jgi:AraC-like DNA-binding protein